MTRPRKRALFLLAAPAALGLLVGLVAVVVYTRPETRYGRARYDQVRLGMPRAEVEALLGPPGFRGNTDSVTWDACGQGEGSAGSWDGVRRVGWWSDDVGAISVGYGTEADEGVRIKSLYALRRKPLWPRLRDRLEL